MKFPPQRNIPFRRVFDEAPRCTTEPCIVLLKLRISVFLGSLKQVEMCTGAGDARALPISRRGGAHEQERSHEKDVRAVSTTPTMGGSCQHYDRQPKLRGYISQSPQFTSLRGEDPRPRSLRNENDSLRKQKRDTAENAEPIS